jgi:hypothetical protein
MLHLVLEIEPKTLCMLHACSTTELHQGQVYRLFNLFLFVLIVLGFELRALSLLGRCSMPPAQVIFLS